MRQQRLDALTYWRQYFRSPGDDAGAKEFCCKKLAQILGRPVAEFGRTFETASEEDLARIWHWMEHDQIWPTDEPIAAERRAA